MTPPSNLIDVTRALITGLELVGRALTEGRREHARGVEVLQAVQQARRALAGDAPERAA